jgi:pilus assembly protein CpaC
MKGKGRIGWLLKGWICLCVSVAADGFAETVLADSNSGQAVVVLAGQQKLLDVPRSTRITLGEEGIVNLRMIGRHQVVLTGKKAGVTDLFFWDGSRRIKTLKVRVTMPLETLAQNIRTLLEEIENARVFITGEKIVIDGKLLTRNDVERVKQIASAVGAGAVLNLTFLDRGEENNMVEQFIREAAGIDTVDVRITGKTAILSGYVSSESHRNKIGKIAETQVESVVNLIEISDMMIETDVLFVEVTNSETYRFGTNLLDGSGGSGKTTAQIEGSRSRVDGVWGHTDILTSWSINVLSLLEAAIGNGDARVLQRSHIGTRSGEKGFFHSGGEMFFKVAGSNSAVLESVEYGLVFSITPSLSTEDKIVSSVRIEVSVPVDTAGSEDLNLDKFVTENTVTCRIGDSIVLSGLIEDLKLHFKERAPLLGDIPLLNLFFSRRTKNESQRELIAVITPRVMGVVKAAEKRAREYHSEALKQTTSSQGQQ